MSSIRNIALIAFFTLVSVFDINAAKASTEENSAPQVVTTQDNPESYGSRDYPVYQKEITNINIYDPKSAQRFSFYIGTSIIGGLRFDIKKSLGNSDVGIF